VQILVILAAAFVLGSAPARAADPLKIRIGWANTPATILPLPFTVKDALGPKEMGFLPVALDPAPYVDFSFIEEAARRLR
jgi:hypothetical protein